MKAQCYFTTPAVKSTRANYRETEIDQMKRNADILVQSIDDKYTLWLNKPIAISGRGIERVSEQMVVVTERVYNRLQAQYNVVMNF